MSLRLLPLAARLPSNIVLIWPVEQKAKLWVQSLGKVQTFPTVLFCFLYTPEYSLIDQDESKSEDAKDW